MEEYSRYILNRLLKKSKITSILKAEGYLFSSCFEDMNILMEQSCLLTETDEEFLLPRSVVVTHHTLERWNQRVGPIVSLETLQRLLEVLFNHFHYRISKLDQGIGLIDHEIVFTYEMTDKEIYITTFYGRRSLVPALNQIKKLRNYNLYCHDQVNLSLSDEELTRQSLPVIPIEVIHFNGKKTSYILEKYQFLGRDLPCFLCYKREWKKKGFTTFAIDLEKPEAMTIPRTVLSMLNRLGYGRFVLDYFSCHHPDKVVKARDKALDFFSSKNDLFLN